MANNYITLDELLLNDKKITKKTKRIKKNEKPSKIKKGKKKRIVVVIAAIILALTTATVGIIYNALKKKNHNTDNNKNKATVEMSIDDLGNELDFPENNTQNYGNTTGNVKVEEKVKKDGIYYNNQEIANK